MIKTTKKEMFAKLLTIAEVASNAEMVEFINKQIELLDKRYSAKSSKPTKSQVENEGFRSMIVDFLKSQDNPCTIKEIQEGLPELGELSNQRIARILNDAYADKVLIKNYVSKRPVYSVAF